MPSAKRLLTEDEKKQVIAAIEAAEKMTSGEITLHIDDFCLGDPFKRAFRIFGKRGLYKTSQRNGVLIYVAIRSKKLAVLGDEGIHKAVPANFWDTLSKQLRTQLAAKNFCAGFCEAIRTAGEQLQTHFPPIAGDKNELSNAISFGS